MGRSLFRDHVSLLLVVAQTVGRQRGLVEAGDGGQVVFSLRHTALGHQPHRRLRDEPVMRRKVIIDVGKRRRMWEVKREKRRKRERERS